MKIDLDPQKTDALAKLMNVGGAGVEALKELFVVAEAELRDVTNIDPKGNMGLQSLAAQRAVEVIQGIKEHVFPSEEGARVVSGKKPAPRQYQ